MELPAGVHPVTSNTPHNQERLAKEVRIIRAPEASSYSWGREQFFTRKSTHHHPAAPARPINAISADQCTTITTARLLAVWQR
jgi:hypothetical protein